MSQDVPSFGALPRGAWMALGILELACTSGLSAVLGLLMAFIAYGRMALEPIV